MIKIFVILCTFCSLSQAQILSKIWQSPQPGLYKATKKIGVLTPDLVLVSNEGKRVFIYTNEKKEVYLRIFPCESEMKLRQQVTQCSNFEDILNNIGTDSNTTLYDTFSGVVTKSWAFYALDGENIKTFNLTTKEQLDGKLTFDIAVGDQGFNVADFPEYEKSAAAFNPGMKQSIDAKEPLDSKNTKNFAACCFSFVFKIDLSSESSAQDRQHDLVFINEQKKHLLKCVLSCEKIWENDHINANKPELNFELVHIGDKNLPEAQNAGLKSQTGKKLEVLFTRDKKLLGGVLHRWDARQQRIVMHPRAPMYALAHDLGHAAGYHGCLDGIHSDYRANVMSAEERILEECDMVDGLYADKVLNFLKK